AAGTSPLPYLHQGGGGRDAQSPCQGTPGLGHLFRAGTGRSAFRSSGPPTGSSGVSARPAAVGAGDRLSGRHEDPDHPLLLPVAAGPLSPRGGNSAELSPDRRARGSRKTGGRTGRGAGRELASWQGKTGRGGRKDFTAGGRAGFHGAAARSHRRAGATAEA